MHTETAPSHRESPALQSHPGRMLADEASKWLQMNLLGLSGVIMKKQEFMARLFLLLEARVCLFWFVAPFTGPSSLICLCLWSCFECVTSVTSSGYCETFMKTALIKPLLYRETETLLLIISCATVSLSVEDVACDFSSSVNSPGAPLQAKKLSLLTLVGFGSVP